MLDHRLGLKTLDSELEPAPLKVDGVLPGWLTGALLRVGPARFEVGDRSYNHWFDGLAMLHRFALADGTVTYANRFVNSPAYRAARTEGRIAYSEFATDPCRSLFKRVATSFLPPAFGDNTNVNIVRRADEFLALTETPLPVRFDPATLETLGVAQPAPGQMTTAHPHVAPRSGERVNYATRFGPITTYRIYGEDERTKRRRMITEFPVGRPSYMHSFAVTERYVVLAEFPFVVIPVAIPLSGKPLIRNYQWKPGRGTRFRVLDLDTGEVRAVCQGPPLFAFHHVNAFERGNEVVIDLCGYDDAEIIDALYLDRMRSPGFRPPEVALRRYRLPLTGGDATREPLPEARLELPRIDYERHNGRPYRYVYGTGDLFDRIVKVDLEEGVTEWSQPGAYPGEPVFVRDPDSDAAVLLSVVLDTDAGTSFLLVLDAGNLTEIARARVPHHIPFGFHGDFFPELG
jgi:beta,beta-carotene 9',10'-dioxygenase